MRAEGVGIAVRGAEPVGVSARALGMSSPAVSTGLSPELLGGKEPELSHDSEIDEIDLLRSQEYGLLANLIANAPTQELLDRLSRLDGDASPLGQAHRTLAVAARTSDADAVSREYFDLFVGIGRGELLPYASYYLTGFLNERPLARVREDLEALGIETSEDVREPEDHVGILCEIMSGLAGRRFGAEPEAERRFFEKHLKPFAERFFADLETATSSRFYRSVGALGRLFIEVEAEAFAIEN